MQQPPDPKFELPSLDQPAEAPVGTADEEDTPHGALAEILHRHTDRLMAIEGVVMVAQGQDEVGRDSITIGVKNAQFLGRLPKTVEGIPVRAEVIGEVDAL